MKVAAKRKPSPISRRRFIAGAGALVLADRLALAQSIAQGTTALSVSDIHGWGEKPGIVNIGNNENPFGPSPQAIRAIADDMLNLNRYDWGALRQLEFAIMRYHGFPPPPPRETPWGPSNNPVYVEGGSSFILRQVALRHGVKNEAGQVIEADPAYGSISRTVQEYGRRFGKETSVVRVPLTADHKHDLDAMLAAVSDRTTLVVITNPNNPTGTLVPREDIESFVDAVPAHVTVFIDEAYVHFARDPNYRDSIDLAKKHKNVIVSRTFSKIFGLAGLRVGYAVADLDVVQDLRFFGNSGGIGRINCYAAAAALGDNAFVRQVKRKTNEGKDFFYGEMQKLGLEYVPSHSSFVLVNAAQDGAALAERMQERNVILSRLGISGNGDYSNFVRFTMGTMEELEVAVQVFKAALAA